MNRELKIHNTWHWVFVLTIVLCSLTQAMDLSDNDSKMDHKIAKLIKNQTVQQQAIEALVQEKDTFKQTLETYKNGLDVFEKRVDLDINALKTENRALREQISLLSDKPPTYIEYIIANRVVQVVLVYTAVCFFVTTYSTYGEYGGILYAFWQGGKGILADVYTAYFFAKLIETLGTGVSSLSARYK